MDLVHLCLLRFHQNLPVTGLVGVFIWRIRAGAWSFIDSSEQGKEKGVLDLVSPEQKVLGWLY